MSQCLDCPLCKSSMSERANSSLGYDQCRLVLACSVPQCLRGESAELAPVESFDNFQFQLPGLSTNSHWYSSVPSGHAGTRQ